MKNVSDLREGVKSLNPGMRLNSHAAFQFVVILEYSYDYGKIVTGWSVYIIGKL